MSSYEYPHLSPEQTQTLKEINATQEQFRSSDISAQNAIDRSLTKNRYNDKSLVFLVTGATGAGKSATANTILGRKVFQEGSSAVSVTTQVQEDNADVDGLKLTVVDTPSSWHTKLDCLKTLTIDVFIMVINLASPRFGPTELDELRSLMGPDGFPLLKSGRCVVVLSHAESALQQMSLKQYLAGIEGDPLHTLLTKDLQGRIIAVNNAASTQYERQANQRAILYLALQAKGGVSGGYGIFKRNMIGGMVALTVPLLLCSILFEWPVLPYLRKMYNVRMGLIRWSIPIGYMIGGMVTLVVAILLGSMLYGWPPLPYLKNKHNVGVAWIRLKSAALLAFLSRGRRPMHMACAIGALSVSAGFLYIAMHLSKK